METKPCYGPCGQIKPLSEFYTYVTSAGTEFYRKQCKECYVAMEYESEKKRRARDREKATRKCVGFCGQERPLSEFDFKCSLCKECRGKGYLSEWIANIKNRVKAKGWDFEIDAAFIQELFSKQSGKCALTKIPFTFNFEKCKTVKKDPFSPSIDRIDSAKGYTKDNVRLVCMVVNLALNEFGDDTFSKMCRAFVQNN